MKRLVVASALALGALGATPHAEAAASGDVLAIVQLCAGSTPFPGAVDAHAMREHWWHLDDERLANLRSSSALAGSAERGWLAAEEEVMLTFSSSNDRLTALSDPVRPGEAVQAVAACTVYGTRTDASDVRGGLEAVTLLRQPLGAPSDEVTLADGLVASHWVVRGESGEVAYVYAQFRGHTAIIEIGRVTGPREAAE